MSVRCGVLGLVLLVVGLAPAGQPSASPLYSLPPDGTWVEYTWTARGPDGQEQSGTLRISSVGRTERQGAPHRWVEFKLEAKAGERTQTKLRKLLIPESAFAGGRSPLGAAVEAYAQNRPGGPVTRLTPAQVNDFLGLGIGPSGVPIRSVGEHEEVETELGRFITRRVTAVGPAGERTLEYHGWLTARVPFGWAKFAILERSGPQTHTLFTATARRTGSGARSELDHSQAR